MGYDPAGTFNWSSFYRGATWTSIGLTALCVGLSVATCGVATPIIMAVATTTIIAGAATTINGISEFGEVATGYNFMRDGLFNGNANAYYTYSGITSGISQAGTFVCGGWMAINAPRINAYRGMKSYSVKNKHLPGANGNWSKFNTSSQNQLQMLGQEVIKNTPMSSLAPNSVDSFLAVYNFGHVIGTEGQMSARLVFSTAGKIITFFPQ